MTAIRLMSVTFLAGALLTATARAADAPTTKPAAASTQGSVSSQAKAELEKVNAAYIGLNSLDLSGKITAHFDIAGQKQNQESEFTSIYLAPNKFRQQVKGDVLAGSTGEKLSKSAADTGVADLRAAGLSAANVIGRAAAAAHLIDAPRPINATHVEEFFR